LKNNEASKRRRPWFSEEKIMATFCAVTAAPSVARHGGAATR
jgi:hypothetical protein